MASILANKAAIIEAMPHAPALFSGCELGRDHRAIDKSRITQLSKLKASLF
ncbi:MAG: hypothetical protein ACXV3U_06430 [Halobacteriota archaeon]